MRTLQADPPVADELPESQLGVEQDSSPSAPSRPAVARARVLALCALYMLLLVAAAVGIDRAVASRLFAHPTVFVPSYRGFQNYDVGVKLQQFRGVENQHFDGFFIGNSRTLFGVNPAVFDTTLGRAGMHFHSYNLAQESVDVRFWRPFFTRYYGRRPPHYVLLGMLPRDLDASYTALGSRYLDAFLASAGFENRNMSTVNRDAEETLSDLYLLHGRVADTHLLTASDILHGRKLDLGGGRLANRKGWMQLPPRVLATPKPFLRAEQQRLARRHGRQPFVLGTAQAQSLAALNDWVRAGGGCLIVYTTPLLYDAEPWGTIEMRRGFDAAMHRLVRTDPGLQFVDVGGRVQGTYTAQDFGDGDHLNGRGATVFSSQLASALRPAMTSPACRAR